MSEPAKVSGGPPQPISPNPGIKKVGGPGAAKKFASVGQSGVLGGAKKVGHVPSASTGGGPVKLGGGLKKTGLGGVGGGGGGGVGGGGAVKGSGAPPLPGGHPATGSLSHNASPLRPRQLPEPPTNGETNGQNGEATEQTPDASSSSRDASSSRDVPSSSQDTSTTEIEILVTSDPYVPKSFRSTVNVDIAALRKGPSTLSLGTMNNSSGMISTEGGSGGGASNMGMGNNPSYASLNSNSNGTSSGTASGGGSTAVSDSSSPTPANATKRIEEMFANPIFSKVEVAIKGKRDNAAYEILTTEQSYCKSLTVLNELYRLPLLEACKKNLFPSVSEELVTDIFSRFFVDISRVNFVLLQGLVERFGEWDDHQLLGDLLLDLLPFLKMYTMYTGNYERSMSALAELETLATKEGSALQAFLGELNANPLKTVDLRSYLIMPIQRIPRYRLLLEELIKNTSAQHADYESLQKALESIKLVASQIDAAIHEQKNRAKMLEIQDSFFGEKVQIIEAGRMFIKEGEMGKVCRKETQNRFVWLFNDLFLYAKQLPSSSRFSKHRAFPLKSIRVKDLMDDGKIYKNAIQIASEKKSFVLLAASAEEKSVWMAEFAKAISEQENKIRIDGNNTTNAVAPVWVPDSEATRCMICGDKFTLMQRRHHCRQCGNVVCSKCSAKKKELPGQGKKRVCDSCYTKPYPDSSLATPPPTSTTATTTTTPHPASAGAAMALTGSPGSVSVGPITITPASPSPSYPSSTTSNHTGSLGSSNSSIVSTSPSPSPAPPTKSGETYRAAYDYEPPVENPKKKLSFKAGDLMEITIKNDPGWWFAVMGDARGWVPASFLEPAV